MTTHNGHNGDFAGLLAEILESVKQLRAENLDLASAIEQINGRINILASLKEVKTREQGLEWQMRRGISIDDWNSSNRETKPVELGKQAYQWYRGLSQS